MSEIVGPYKLPNSAVIGEIEPMLEEEWIWQEDIPEDDKVFSEVGIIND